MEFNIETYLNSLPEDTEEIIVSNRKLTYLPSVERFTKLKHLDCLHNKLTSLPELNDELLHLICFWNQLTSVPPRERLLKLETCNIGIQDL
jgi:hypothetical protein